MANSWKLGDDAHYHLNRSRSPSPANDQLKPAGKPKVHLAASPSSGSVKSFLPSGVVPHHRVSLHSVSHVLPQGVLTPHRMAYIPVPNSGASSPQDNKHPPLPYNVKTPTRTPTSAVEQSISAPNAAQPPQPDYSTLPIMQGVINNLKHSYGFVRCDQTGDRIFFHYSEISAKSLESLPSAPPDLPPVIIGDRVRFYRVRDEMSGKEKAVSIEVVARTRSSFVLPDKGAEQPSGGKEPFALHHDAMSLPAPLIVATRETGIVVSSKSNYGFIKCAERDHRQVFFHFSEVVNSAELPLLIAGAEVDFALSTAADGRIVACQVRMLPAGTVSFATVQNPILFGIIEAGIENQTAGSSKTRRRARPSSNDQGTLVLHAKERARADIPQIPLGVDTTLSFCGADIKFPGIKLFHGDQVGFRVKIDRRTGEMSATDIFLMRCSSRDRQRGIITIWKELYGFLKCDGKREQMFVHLNEYIEKAQQPMVGDEVEFNVAPDNRGQDNAIRISILPKGSVNLEDDRVMGVVVEKPVVLLPQSGMSRAASQPTITRTISEHAAADAHTTSVVYGVIRTFAPAVKLHDDHSTIMASWAKTATLSDDECLRFVLADLCNPANPLRCGDVVSVVVAPAPKYRRGASIRPAPKRGIVSDIALNQIVVKVAGNIYGHSELFEFIANDDCTDVQIGDQVEIGDIGTGSSPRAMRIAGSLKKLKVPRGGAGRALRVVQLGVDATSEPKTPKVKLRKPTLTKSISLDLSPSSHRRWQLRLEPRPWGNATSGDGDDDLQ